MMNHHCCRLGVFPFALAIGITSGLGMLIMGLLAMHYHWGTPVVNLVASLYKGYAPTVEGALWGGLWGFIDGFICGIVIVFIYNICIRCCKPKGL